MVEMRASCSPAHEQASVAVADGVQLLLLGDSGDSAFPQVLQSYFPSTSPVKGARQS